MANRNSKQTVPLNKGYKTTVRTTKRGTTVTSKPTRNYTKLRQRELKNELDVKKIEQQEKTKRAAAYSAAGAEAITATGLNASRPATQVNYILDNIKEKQDYDTDNGNNDEGDGGPFM